MSSILNRLREVQGVASPDPGSPIRRTHAPSGALAHDVKEISRWAARKAAAFRVLAGAFAVFTVFLLWRAWKGQSPEGITLTQNQKPAIATPEQSPPGAPAHAGANEEQSSVTPRGPKGSGLDLPEDAIAAAASKTAEVTVSGEKRAMGSGQGSPSSERPAESTGVDRSRTTAEAGNTLTAKEDEEVKRILRNLKVTGVYRDANGYLAFINGRELQSGDQVGPIKIAEIRSERITFAFKEKRYIVRLR